MSAAAVALLARSSLAFFRRHPAQLALSFTGIVLGVGIVVAVLVTNTSARRAFALSSETLYGRATHQVLGAEGIAATEYAALRRALPTLAMAPVVEGRATIGAELLTLLGLDPFAEAGFGRIGIAEALEHAAAGTGEGALDDALALVLDEDALLLAETTRARLGLALDAPLALEAGGREHSLRLVGSFESESPAAGEGLLIADIALAERLLGRPGRLDRIDLILAGEDVARLREALPPSLRLVESAARERTMVAMTRGFQINLTAMSLLALVVGAFLIHNTMSFAVLQRRELFAVKRIGGVTRRMLFASVLAEAALIGLAGAVAGAALGHALAHALIRLTTRTINDLYFTLHVQEVVWSPWLAAAAVALGVGTSVAAASLAAREAAATSPVRASRRSGAERRARAALPRLALAGASAALLGAALAASPSVSLVTGFVALTLLILGYGVALPWVTLALARALRRPLARLGVIWSLAGGGIERNISRTGLAIAALAIAVAATFGVEVMITSFRASVAEWLATTLRSDLYIAAEAELAPASVEAVRGTPGVAELSGGRVVATTTAFGDIDTLVLEPHSASVEGFEFLAGEAEGAWRAFLEEDAVLVSEPLATRHALVPGDTLALFTARAGERPFRVAGVVRDYGSSHGRLTMSRATRERHWAARGPSSLGLLLEPGADAETVLGRLRERLADAPQALELRSNRAIREQSLAIFDRTFEITRVLRWLTVGVAFVGIFSALLALHLERAREFAVLRASGATRAQLSLAVSAQTLLMGLLAGLLALPLGLGMSVVLIHVVNLRSFGWSMATSLPPAAPLEALALACLSALLAGLYPAWRLSRRGIAARLREE